MNHRVAGMVVASLVITSGFLALLTVVPWNAAGTILYVGGVGPGNYTSIGTAVILASPGDTIYVYSGTYSESNVIVDKQLALIGQDRATTIIDGGGVSGTLSIMAEGATMEEFTINRGVIGLWRTNESRVSNLTMISSGLWVQYANNNTVADCTFSGFENTGIDLVMADNNTFVRNTIAGSRQNGIYVDFSDNNLFRNNSISGSSKNGIWLRSSNNNTFEGNTVTSSVEYGMRLDDSVGNTISNGSVLLNAFAGIYVYASVPAMTSILNNNVSLNVNFGIILRAEDNTVTDNTLISNSDAAIHVDDHAFQTLTGNRMFNNGIFIYGWDLGFWISHVIDTSNMVNGKPVYYWKNVVGGTIPPGAGQVILANASRVTVQDQTIDNASVGILIGVSSNNTIALNTLTNHSMYGIYLQRYSYDNIVANNSVRGNSGGIFLTSSRRNSVFANTLADNGFGISSDSSSYNEYAYNTLSNNDVGFNLYAGDDSRVHHNDILANAQQAEQSMGANFWDDGYPSGGNHWSDYTGVDLMSGPNQDQPGSDGIGDTPYACPSSGGVVDNYPLMQPVGRFPPSEPVNLVAVPGDAQVGLTWSPPLTNGSSPVTGYIVYRGTSSGGEVALTTLANVLAYTDTGLANGVTYFYTVAAVNGYGQGPNSTEVNATPATIPSEPLNLMAVAMDGQVALTWTAPASDGGSPITNYSIYRGTASGGETLLVTLGNVLTFTDTAVTNGQTYHYRVSAWNGIGEGGKSSEVVAQPTSGQPTGGKSILGETWFWIVIVAVVIAIVAVAVIITRRRRRNHEVAEPSEEEEEEVMEKEPED